MQLRRTRVPRRGDLPQEFSAFVGENWASLFRLAFLLTGSVADAKDTLQMVLTRIWPRWEKLARTREPLAYVRRSVVNGCMDVHRSVRRGAELAARVAPLAEGTTVSWEQSLVESDALWRAVDDLPARQRAVVVLRYWSDLSELEIAEVLGCRPGTDERRPAHRRAPTNPGRRRRQCARP